MDTFAVVRRTLAADLACDEADLQTEGVHVVLAEERPGRRRFPFRERIFGALTMGVGAVVTCDATRLEWARRELGHLDRNALFNGPALARIQARVAEDGQALHGPHVYTVWPGGEVPRVAAPAGVDIEVVDGTAVADLYQYDGFRHALSYLTGSPRPDMLAAVARAEGRIVGVAGASADSEDLWQIGVDVVDGERGRGIGRAIVGRITAEVVALGRVPYYSAVVSNVPSQRLAIGLGYRLAWVEMLARAPT